MRGGWKTAIRALFALYSSVAVRCRCYWSDAAYRCEFCVDVRAASSACQCDCAKMICGGSLSSPGPTRPARRADLSFQGIASVAMRSSVFTPLDNVEEFCPKKLPCAYDTDGPLEHSATAAFDPERPHLANTAAAARCKKCSTESTPSRTLPHTPADQEAQPWASASPSRRSSST